MAPQKSSNWNSSSRHCKVRTIPFWRVCRHQYLELMAEATLLPLSYSVQRYLAISQHSSFAPRRTPGRAGAAWSVRGSGSYRDTAWWCLVAAYRLSCRPSPRRGRRWPASCRPRRRRGRAFSLARALRRRGRMGRMWSRRKSTRSLSAATRTARRHRVKGAYVANMAGSGSAVRTVAGWGSARWCVYLPRCCKEQEGV